jgi:membrane associated rhomboid family serine protease
VIPYHDENATVRTPIVTFLFLAANIAAWFAPRLLHHVDRAARLGHADLLDAPPAGRGLHAGWRRRGGGVAFWAHIGGFVAGLVLVKLLERPDRLRAHQRHHFRPRRTGWR